MRKGIHNSGKLITVVLAVLWLPLTVAGSTIVDIVDWDDNPPSSPWDVRTGAGDATVTVEGPVGSQWLQISMDAENTNTLVAGSAADLFAGAWNTDYWIEFDFWASNAAPDALEVRWSATESDTIWGASVLSPYVTAGSWQTMRTPNFSNFQDWDPGNDPSLGEVDFLADLASVDWIGFYVYEDTASEDIYGVDDVSLMVPEPAEIVLAASALCVAFLALRRQRFSLATLLPGRHD